MDLKDKKRGRCNLKLNSLIQTDDPLLMKATFSILDFDLSGNGDIVEKDVAIEGSGSLKGKPLLCVYYPNTNTVDNPNDHFGDHGEDIKQDRYGNDYIGTNSIAIGTALEGGYITTIKDSEGNDKEILACDFYLWADRNIEILQLINEMVQQGIPLYSSCEYYYFNYEVNDGVCKVKSPIIFSGHCCLGSGENDTQAVAPAYDTSKLLSFNQKLNSAIHNQLIQNNKNSDKSDKKSDLNINNKKEDETMADSKEGKVEMFKKICELSFDDIRSQIYGCLRNTLSEDEYYDSYVTECYDGYFVLSYWNASNHKYYKVTYTKENDNVSIDWENRTEVFLYQEWKEIQEVQNSLNAKDEEINKANNKIADLEKKLNEKEDLIKSTNAKVEKGVTVDKFNELTETIISLNAKVKELQPLADQYNKDQYEKSLNSAKEFYKEKFESVDALDVFEKEDTQELIKKSINSDEKESQEAKLDLSNLIINSLKPINEPQVNLNSVQPVKENKELTDHIDEFESFYGFKK